MKHKQVLNVCNFSIFNENFKSACRFIFKYMKIDFIE